MIKTTIRIAGNTAAPCLEVIRAKGYKVTMSAQLLSDDISDIDYYNYCAEKDDVCLDATNLEELLGLITLWEMRGEQWKTTPNEYDNLMSECVLYDVNGNVVQE